MHVMILCAVTTLCLHSTEQLQALTVHTLTGPGGSDQKRESRGPDGALLLFCCSIVSDSLRPVDSNTPGLPVLHHLLELAQIHVHQVRDAIQPSHPLSSLSPPVFNLSQNQGLIF